MRVGDDACELLGEASTSASGIGFGDAVIGPRRTAIQIKRLAKPLKMSELPNSPINSWRVICAIRQMCGFDANVLLCLTSGPKLVPSQAERMIG